MVMADTKHGNGKGGPSGGGALQEVNMTVTCVGHGSACIEYALNICRTGV